MPMTTGCDRSVEAAALIVPREIPGHGYQQLSGEGSRIAGRVEIWRGGGRFSRNCFRPFRSVGV